MTTAVIDCSFERHAEAILGILNKAIANSTALSDDKPRSLQDVAAWFEARHKSNFAVIGVENDTGKLLAFASYGMCRTWPAYQYTLLNIRCICTQHIMGRIWDIYIHTHAGIDCGSRTKRHACDDRCY